MKLLVLSSFCAILSFTSCKESANMEHSRLNHENEVATAESQELDRNGTLRPLGFFSNEESFDGEHNSGYFIQIWNQGKHLVGRATKGEGLIGDETIAYFDTGHINSAEEVSIQGDDFSFEGKLSSSGLNGKMTWMDQEPESVFLEKCCVDAPMFRTFQNYDEWEAAEKELE